jgi:RimJ/RimL family protein N-acetyltransferase
VRLVSVYSTKGAASVLYDLLKEREPHVNISHREMPTWEKHEAFVQSCPYLAWYLLRIGRDYVGSIYLTDADEIGVFLFHAHRGNGYAEKAIGELIRLHPRPRYLANVNPENARSIALFQKLGFSLLQQTYELRNA